MAPAVEDGNTSIGQADWIGSEPKEPSDNVHVDGGKTGVLSRVAGDRNEREARTRIRIMSGNGFRGEET